MLSEHLDRVRSMSVDVGETWDLSDNDREALANLLRGYTQAVLELDMAREDRDKAEREAVRLNGIGLTSLGYLSRAVDAEAEVARLNLPENRGIGDTEIVTALKERDALRMENASLRERVDKPWLRLHEMGFEMVDQAPDLDLDLLRKLASGEGGRRTGALKRAGYLTWEVTEAGRKALEGGT